MEQCSNSGLHYVVHACDRATHVPLITTSQYACFFLDSVVFLGPPWANWLLFLQASSQSSGYTANGLEGAGLSPVVRCSRVVVHKDCVPEGNLPFPAWWRLWGCALSASLQPPL